MTKRLRYFARSNALLQLADIRGFGTFHMAFDSLHPRIQALQALGEHLDEKRYLTIAQALHRWYNYCSFSDTSNWWGFVPADPPKCKCEAVVLPWQSSQVHMQPESCTVHIMGPVPESYIAAEAKKLLKLHTSIKHYGITQKRRRGQLIVVDKIVNGDAAVYFPVTGNHRIACSGALGQQTLPVFVRRTVDVAAAKDWPQIACGRYTTEEVERIVSVVFGTVKPAWWSSWAQICAEENP